MSLHFHFIVVTNNPLVRERFEGQVPLDYQPRTFAGILEYVRDQIHKGHKLLSHPLSGSVKPGETPYKSIMISAEQGALDTDSVILIEDCIQHAKKFRDRISGLSERVLDDFQLVDCNLITSAIESALTGH